jgi:hypothetical protein
MRAILAVIGILGLAACAGPVRDAGAQGDVIARPAVSDEQDFDAVAARETIESDRERLERQRQQYVAIAPQPVPQRTGDTRPNIVEYAIRTTNRRGESVHRRGNPLRWSLWERACARFTTQDQAQEEFLRRGGPERDPGNLDPDGDGFACWWDPAPFRNAVQGVGAPNRL